MKKFVCFLMLLVTVVTLSACTTDEEKSLTIKFETNGGTEINDMIVTEANIATVVIPTTTQEGKNFVAWYTNADLTADYTIAALTSALESGEITLYAKWEDAVDPIVGQWTSSVLKVTFNANNTVVLNVGGIEIDGTYTVAEDGAVAIKASYLGTNMDTTGTFVNGVLTLSFQGVSVTFKKYEPIVLPTIEGPIDIKYTVNASIAAEGFSYIYDENGEQIRTPENYNVDVELTVTAKVEEVNVEKVSDLKAMFEIDAKLGMSGTSAPELPVNQIKVALYIANGKVVANVPGFLFDSEAETVQVVADLEAILDEVVKLIPAEIPTTTPEEAIETIQTYYDMLVIMLQKAGLTDELVDQFVAVLAGLLPTETVNGSTTTYTITDEQVKATIANLGKFFSDNIDAIVAILENIYTDNGGATVIEDEETSVKEELLGMIGMVVEMLPTLFEINDLSVAITENADGNFQKGVLSVDVDLFLEDINPDVTNVSFDFEIGVEVGYEKVTVTVPEVDPEAMDITAMIIEGIQDAINDHMPPAEVTPSM